MSDKLITLQARGYELFRQLETLKQEHTRIVQSINENEAQIAKLAIPGELKTKAEEEEASKS